MLAFAFRGAWLDAAQRHLCFFHFVLSTWDSLPSVGIQLTAAFALWLSFLLVFSFALWLSFRFTVVLVFAFTFAFTFTLVFSFTFAVVVLRSALVLSFTLLWATCLFLLLTAFAARSFLLLGIATTTRRTGSTATPTARAGTGARHRGRARGARTRIRTVTGT